MILGLDTKGTVSSGVVRLCYETRTRSDELLSVLCFGLAELQAEITLHDFGTSNRKQRRLNQLTGGTEMSTKVAILTLGFLGLSGLASADAWDERGRTTVTLWNESGYTIERFYMSSTSNPYWSADLLGRGRLASGYHTNFIADLGRYDVKLVDSDGDECVVNGVQIGGDRRLTITRDLLLRCEGYR